MLTLPLSCVVSISVPQFSHLWNADSKSTHLRVLRVNWDNLCKALKKYSILCQQLFPVCRHFPLVYRFLLLFLSLPNFLKDQQTLDVCTSPSFPFSNLFHLGLGLPPLKKCLSEAAHDALSPQRMLPKPASLALPFLLISLLSPAHISSISNGPLSISIS